MIVQMYDRNIVTPTITSTFIRLMAKYLNKHFRNMTRGIDEGVPEFIRQGWGGTSDKKHCFKPIPLVLELVWLPVGRLNWFTWTNISQQKLSFGDRDFVFELSTAIACHPRLLGINCDSTWFINDLLEKVLFEKVQMMFEFTGECQWISGFPAQQKSLLIELLPFPFHPSFIYSSIDSFSSEPTRQRGIHPANQAASKPGNQPFIQFLVYRL